MNRYSLAIASILALASAPVFANEDAGRTISDLGAQGTGYVQVKEGFSAPCTFGVVYLPDLSQYNSRAMMAVLLSAQNRGAQVTITYDQAASGVCTASKVSAK